MLDAGCGAGVPVSERLIHAGLRVTGLDFSAGRARTVIALDDALTALAAIDSEQARLVELRFYAGMTAEEIAGLTGISVHRVRHRLRSALAWLHREVNGRSVEA